MSNEKSGVFKFRFDASSRTLYTRKNSIKIIKRLIRSLSPYKRKLQLFAIVTVLYSVSYVVFPRLLGSILDMFSGSIVTYMLGLGDGTLFRDILPYGIVALTVFLFNALFAFLQGNLISDIITSYSLSLRSAVMDKFNSIPVSFVEASDHKELLSKMTQDIDALNQSLNIIFVRLFSSVTLFIAVTVMQFSLSVPLGAVSIGFCVLTVLFSLLKRKREEASVKKQQSGTNELFDRASEFYSGMPVAQISGKLENITRELADLNRKVSFDSRKSKGFTVLQKGINELFSGICIVTVAVLGTFATSAGSISIGILQCQFIYVRRLFSAFSELSLISGVCSTLISSAGSLFDFFDITENENSNENETMPVQTEEDKIDFENVYFRYNEDSKLILKNVSFSLGGKGITVLSGITGVGKTTIIKLVLGFYKPVAGKVLYNGKEVWQLPKRDYLSKFNIIIQGATLFNDTIYNNIAYGSSQYSKEQVKAAAKLCGADKFIENLPDGYETVFDPWEPDLSEGEIQLVLLARAFLRKRDFVIFDEATSGVDIMIEKKINRALAELSKECSVIVISHRSSAIVQADKTVHLSDAEVTQVTNTAKADI